MTFFSCRLLATPTFTRRLYSVLSKFSDKTLILGRVLTPQEGVDHPRRSSPATLVTPMDLFLPQTKHF